MVTMIWILSILIIILFICVIVNEEIMANGLNSFSTELSDLQDRISELEEKFEEQNKPHEDSFD